MNLSDCFVGCPRGLLPLLTVVAELAIRTLVRILLKLGFSNFLMASNWHEFDKFQSMWHTVTSVYTYCTVIFLFCLLLMESYFEARITDAGSATHPV